MTRPATGSPSPSEAAVPSMFGALSGRRTMTDAVYEQLKAAIVELRIPPGAPLREAEIAQGLSVSKTPVREALGRLEQDGLVTLNSFRSATVTDYTARDLQEIYELREIIEVAAARAAAESMSEKGLADLGRIASECVRLNAQGGGGGGGTAGGGGNASGGESAGSATELVQLISEFDTVLYEEVTNRRIRAILENLAAHLARIGRLTTEIPGRIDASVREHAQIYEAIERRDPETASRFMRDHIRSVRDDQLRALPALGTER
ncbi:MAG: GntR family transcriptional regulator [Streptosporangiaceae bacterium]